jgi:hypothetical protein
MRYFNESPMPYVSHHIPIEAPAGGKHNPDLGNKGQRI